MNILRLSSVLSCTFLLATGCGSTAAAPAAAAADTASGETQTGDDATADGATGADATTNDTTAGDAATGGDAAVETAGDSGAGADAAATGSIGMFFALDGVDRSFTTSPSAEVSFSAGADSPLTGVKLTAGDKTGETLLIRVTMAGADLLAVGEYPCKNAQFQYMAAGAAAIYGTAGATGKCSVAFTEIGAKNGGHIVGTFSATLPKTGGTTEVVLTKGKFDIVRNLN